MIKKVQWQLSFWKLIFTSMFIYYGVEEVTSLIKKKVVLLLRNDRAKLGCID